MSTKVVEISAETMGAAFDAWGELWAGIENPPGSGDGIAEATSALEQLQEIVGISTPAQSVLYDRIKAEMPSTDPDDPEQRETAYQRVAITAAIVTLLAMHGECRLQHEAEMS